MKKLLFIISAFLLAIGFTNCTKSKLGCTDPDAENYVPLADTENNSCKYGIDLTIFLSNSTAENLRSGLQIPPLSITIGGAGVATRYLGEIHWETDSTYADAPACDETSPNTFNTRYVNFTKGPSLVVFKGKNGVGDHVITVKRELVLGSNECATISI